ncbi:hypothetical protein AB9P05_16570 [Roseivirga sp. BDSF3-8]|uniref:hypothetical protein n=1 Tax=Roseivirga sp. BDSF3-8 TaxID=3241598 RepID=UPI003532556B
MSKKSMKLAIGQLIIGGMLILPPAIAADTVAMADTVVMAEDNGSESVDRGEEEIDEYDIGTPAVGIMALIMVLFLLVLVGVGLAIGVFIFLVISGLAFLGILSASAVVGVYQKSSRQGIKTFLLLSCTLAGAASGAVILYVLNRVVHWVSEGYSLGIGAATGLVAGVLISQGLFFVGERAYQYLKLRLKQ